MGKRHNICHPNKSLILVLSMTHPGFNAKFLSKGGSVPESIIHTEYTIPQYRTIPGINIISNW